MFTPRGVEKPKLKAPAPGRYTLYGWQQSYFTRKLEAALIFYGAEYDFVPKTSDNAWELQMRSGTHQIPLLHTPEHWMLADTTPIMQLLDTRYPARAMFPEGAVGVLAQILEEHFDEWIPRTAVHWRWSYPENHALLSMSATGGDQEMAEKLIAWGTRVCRATGVGSATQKKAAEEEYLAILEAAESQLQQTAFLLGGRPTALDCIVLGGLRAHFNYDPAPKAVIHDRFPTVIDWCERRADTWDGTGELTALPKITPFADFVLEQMSTTWAPFVQANAAALGSGEKAFVIPMYGEQVSYLARPYVERSRQMIIDRLALLSDAACAAVVAALPEAFRAALEI
ncbi:MAG: glutathione S-transferase family protein [Bradymonadia bacterium]